MKNKFKASLLISVLLSNSFWATDINGTTNIINSFRKIEQNLSNLKYNKSIQFKSTNAKFLYNKTLRDLRESIDDLSDLSDGSNQDLENFRGRSSIILRNELSFSYIEKALKTLPKFVSENDLKAILAIVEEPPNYVTLYLISYFKNHGMNPKKDSFRGQAGAYIVQEVMRTYLKDSLETLPSFLTNDDFLAVKNIVDESSQSKISKLLKSYFGTI
ncbi:MAG: hypothetical protein COB02_12985 [Candidatus Cloacimonadota bacterium]|nr:MAG: hypothetical protein COB02_12985 [Candidatus Cloacimonadota bacterium]